MRFYSALFSLALLALGLVAVVGIGVFDHYSHDLPDYSYLKDYQPPILSRVYANDGRMLSTIAAEERIFVPINVIPNRVKDAFLSAEDREFYQHGGVDFAGIARAVLANISNLSRGRRPEGASTITQQVAKNMLLGNEVSLSRKVREAILATRIEKALSKDRILEIYLNEIFLGNRSYGVAAAALNYFNKSLDELTVAEADYLAALPKAPNNYNPTHAHEAALARRNWVINRMLEDGHITPEEAADAIKEPLEMRARGETEVAAADYYAEEVRRELVDRFGEQQVLTSGLAVKTSLDPHIQDLATKALKDGLINFDRRERGWRGPVAHLDTFADWQKHLQKMAPPPGGEDWPLAVVIANKPNESEIAFADNTHGQIPLAELKWARRQLDWDKFGPAISKPADVLNPGDIIMVESVKTSDDKCVPPDPEEDPHKKPVACETHKPYAPNTYTLRQVPQVQGAIVVLDPNTGRVYALTGGFSAKISQFDRATQAYRQPGSSFKPFVYMAALDKGFTPSSLILDAPFEYNQGPGLPLWKPENYDQDFMGATPLRVGVEKSRNVMTARLANAIGMPIVAEYAKKFGIVDDMPLFLSFSLGAKETTPLRLTSAYGMIVNGGKRIVPSLIDRVQDRDGKTIWRTDQRDCAGCQTMGWSPDALPPDIPDTREQVEDPRTAYQMVSILTGVVQRGTAVRLKDIGIPLAGKTGTTSDSKDAWFIGFTPDLVCGVYVGFDDPEQLGSRETGASVAVPIFKQFIEGAIQGKPAIPFRVPPGLREVRVNPATGALASIGEKDAIWESFIPGTEPQDGQARPVLDGSVTGAASEGAAAAMTAPDSNATEGANEPVSVPTPSSMPMEVKPAKAPPTSPATLGTGGLY
jgi:penicillin-binding protein 1A